MVSIIDNINFNLQQERSKSSIGYYPTYESPDNTFDGGESSELTDINNSEKYCRSMSSETLDDKKTIGSVRSRSTLPGGGKKRKYIPVKKFVTSNKKDQAYQKRIKEGIVKIRDYIKDRLEPTLNDYIMKSKVENSVTSLLEKILYTNVPELSQSLHNLDKMKQEFERITNEKNEAKKEAVDSIVGKFTNILPIFPAEPLRKRSRTGSDITETRSASDSISSNGSNSAPSSPRRIKTRPNNINTTSKEDTYTEKKSPHSISHPYGSYNIRFQTWNLGGIDPTISVTLWEEFIKDWIKNKRTNDEDTIKDIIDKLVSTRSFFDSKVQQYQNHINKMKDSMYKNFQKSKLIVFSLLKFLHNKIESKNKFDYIFYSLQEVNYVMQKLLTTGIKLEENGNFGIKKFFTQESNQKKYNVASEYIISLTSSEVYYDSITPITLDYKIIFSNHSNEFTNAIIYPEEIKKVKELSANIGTKFKNTLYTEWNTYLGQKQIQSDTYPWDEKFDINKHKTSLRNNTHTKGYFKQFQNARDAKLHSNVLHGVIFELNDIKFLLVNCHHPRLDDKWFEQLIRFNSMFQILDTWTTNNPTIENKIILTGDFNINYNTKEGKKVYDFLVSREFDQETIDIFNSFDVKPELYKKEIKNRFNNYNEDKFKFPDYKTQISKNRVGNNILDYIFVSSNIKQEGFNTHNKDIVVSDMNKYYTPTFVSRKIKSFSGNHSEGRYGLISDHGVEKLLLCLNKKCKFEKKDNISNQESVSTMSTTNVLDINKCHYSENNKIIDTHFQMCKKNTVYKRSLCYHFSDQKGCMKGDKCCFAHGSKERTLVHKIHDFIKFNPEKTVDDFIEYDPYKTSEVELQFRQLKDIYVLGPDRASSISLS